MKAETFYVTLDNKLHKTLDDAKRHAEKVYGEELSKVAHKIVALNWKYSAVMEWLDTNLQLFPSLINLKNDANTFIPEDWDEGSSTWDSERKKWVRKD